MFLLYDLIFLIFGLIYLFCFLFRRKFQGRYQGFCCRLGWLPLDLKLEQPIWIHAVSVGEVMAVSRLLKELKRLYPHKKFVISTTTPTGNKVARNIASDTDLVTYLPLDISFIVHSVIHKIKPSFFIIVETEIWPNLITYLYKKSIPLIVVNARISDRSFGGYLAIKSLLKPILNKITIFCVQTKRDAERLANLGVIQNKIQITGNMKFDIKEQADLKMDYTDYRLKLGLSSHEMLLVAGSTHSGEDEIILEAYNELLSDFSYLRLLIAPRHPERTDEIINLIKKFNLASERISLFAPLHPESPGLQTGDERNIKLESTGMPRPLGRGVTGFTVQPANGSAGSPSLPPFLAKSRDRPMVQQVHHPSNPPERSRGTGQPVFILDTVGQLVYYYAISDIVFVGGSLVKKGGHNILEPASRAKPILFGPYMFNFRDIADLFLEHQAAILVHNKEELKTAITGLLNNPLKGMQFSQRAKKLIDQNQGATGSNLKIIRDLYAKLSL